MLAGHGELNSGGHRVFALVCLLLPEFVPSASTYGLWLHGNTGLGDGDAGAPNGNPYSGDQDSSPRGHGDSVEMRFAFTEGGRTFRRHSRSPRGEEGGNSGNFEDETAGGKEGPAEGILRHANGVKSDGGRFEATEEVDDEKPNVACNHSSSEVVGPDANATTAENRASAVQEPSRNASISAINSRFEDTSQQGGHPEHRKHVSDESRSAPKDKTQTGSEQLLKLDTYQSAVNSHHVSKMAARSTENNGTSRSDDHTSSDSNDMIIFPDELEHDEEESEDGSPVGTYFFIRAPLRNRTGTKCPPNQIFFRRRCRPYHP